MNKKLIWFVLGLLGLGACVWGFTMIFETAEEEQYFSPSREARANEYLALDRWLTGGGYAVRVVSTGNLQTLKNAAEETILIQSELFNWNAEVFDYLESWVDKGGRLILCLDYYRKWDSDDELGFFLEKLGVEPADDPDNRSYKNNSLYPSFGKNIHFKAPVDEAVLLLKDEDELIRLIQLPHGYGKITVTGRIRFMASSNLDTEANARLSWYLCTGNTDGLYAPVNDKAGILFIRGHKRNEGFMGSIFQKGNFAIIIISALILIAIGFWAAIPVFGLVRGGEGSAGKALAERFLAEGLFLRRYKALEHYRAVYFRELRRRIKWEEAKEHNLKDEDIIKRAAEIWAGGDTKKALSAEKALSSRTQSKKNFMESVVILKTILERL
ncbi:MAG: hypothetical protein LBH43_18595 [Treponema sp.]|nr:hypothetical protein [Treponema sp.]